MMIDRAAVAAPAALSAHVVVQRPSLHVDITLDIQRATTVAIMGPNGAGKSTILDALAGLVAIDAGRIVVDGVVLDDADSRTFLPSHRRNVALVRQDSLLFPHLSVLDNVAFGPRARGMPAQPAADHAMAWLQAFAIDEFANARPRTLSGGEAQRVSLARAMAADPTLLLLDEPLSALDVFGRIAVRRDLRELLNGRGQCPGGARAQLTTVLVSHDPADVFAMADWVLIVEGGRVVQQDTPAQIAANPRTRYVAGVLGVNLLNGTANGPDIAVAAPNQPLLCTAESSHSGPVLITFMPDRVRLSLERPTDAASSLMWCAHISSVEPAPGSVRVSLSGPDGTTAELSTARLAELDLDVGRSVWATVEAGDLNVQPA